MNHRHEDFQSTALPLSYPGEEKRYALGGIVLGCQAATVQRDCAREDAGAHAVRHEESSTGGEKRLHPKRPQLGEREM